MAKGKFVLDIIADADEPVRISLDINGEFKEWFKEQHGLKRWSQRRFELAMASAVSTMVEYEKLVAEEAGCEEH